MIGVEKRSIVLTEADYRQIEDVLDYTKNVLNTDERYVEMLQEELESAEIVPSEAIPPDVVTMNSQVRVKDLDTGKISVYTLVFPRQANLARNRISVLAPLGTALLGYRVGDVIEWRMPGGLRRLKVEAVLYQPEAVGEAYDPDLLRALA